MSVASDEPPLESDLHLQQIIILLSCLELLWQEKNDYYASGNLTVTVLGSQLSGICLDHRIGKGSVHLAK